MRYVQYSRGGSPRPGLLYNESVIDLTALLELLGAPVPGGLSSLRAFIEAGEQLWEVVTHDLGSTDRETLQQLSGYYALEEIALEAPLQDAHKLILLAGNYREHICEVGYRVPQTPESVTPQFFMKPPSTTVIGPGQPVRLSRGSIWVDWEVELAVVIGKRGRYILEDQAMDFVFGYTILNDISERAFNSELTNRFVREKDPLFDWLHGKWFDTFAPMGPAVVTSDEIPNPHNLRITLYRNGAIEQDANTSQMIHRIPYLIHKLSQIMTLEPGDVLSTGTPSGVGHSKGLRLEDGDVLECRIEGIGALQNWLEAEK